MVSQPYGGVAPPSSQQATEQTLDELEQLFQQLVTLDDGVTASTGSSKDDNDVTTGSDASALPTVEITSDSPGSATNDAPFYTAAPATALLDQTYDPFLTPPVHPRQPGEANPTDPTTVTTGTAQAYEDAAARILEALGGSVRSNYSLPSSDAMPSTTRGGGGDDNDLSGLSEDLSVEAIQAYMAQMKLEVPELASFLDQLSLEQQQQQGGTEAAALASGATSQFAPANHLAPSNGSSGDTRRPRVTSEVDTLLLNAAGLLDTTNDQHMGQLPTMSTDRDLVDLLVTNEDNGGTASQDLMQMVMEELQLERKQGGLATAGMPGGGLDTDLLVRLARLHESDPTLASASTVHLSEVNRVASSPQVDQFEEVSGSDEADSTDEDVTDTSSEEGRSDTDDETEKDSMVRCRDEFARPIAPLRQRSVAHPTQAVHGLDGRGARQTSPASSQSAVRPNPPEGASPSPSNTSETSALRQPPSPSSLEAIDPSLKMPMNVSSDNLVCWICSDIATVACEDCSGDAFCRDCFGQFHHSKGADPDLANHVAHKL
ncbi:hypothetical protein IWQ60_012074 [Tieghemiomyces parasiticus]|uniref:Uncharacterized protein n=1 Tax=Tieghemiomyces parasiticus TaxID=78921 RepID=A0A9W7ZPC4_9FUNG|nr:hypothetical protein IWQ60_012074 [Tieghemiomyces parasiticus]